MAVTVPAIHMNGTSAGELKREIREAYEAVKEARNKLILMTVHSRDHYIKADKDSYSKARGEHLVRLSLLEQINSELLELHKGIEAQTKEGA